MKHRGAHKVHHAKCSPDFSFISQSNGNDLQTLLLSVTESVISFYFPGKNGAAYC